MAAAVLWFDAAHYVEDFFHDSMCVQDYLPSSEDMWLPSEWLGLDSFTTMVAPICQLRLFFGNLSLLDDPF